MPQTFRKNNDLPIRPVWSFEKKIQQTLMKVITCSFLSQTAVIHFLSNHQNNGWRQRVLKVVNYMSVVNNAAEKDVKYSSNFVGK